MRFPIVIRDLGPKFGLSMRDGVIMRAMAAILIQSIGMTLEGFCLWIGADLNLL